MYFAELQIRELIVLIYTPSVESQQVLYGTPILPDSCSPCSIAAQLLAGSSSWHHGYQTCTTGHTIQLSEGPKRKICGDRLSPRSTIRVRPIPATPLVFFFFGDHNPKRWSMSDSTSTTTLVRSTECSTKLQLSMVVGANPTDKSHGLHNSSAYYWQICICIVSL